MLTKALDRGGHLALERLAAHLAVSYNFESGMFLEYNRVIHSTVFDFLELGSREGARSELLLGRKQSGRAQQAADDVGLGVDHGWRK